MSFDNVGGRQPSRDFDDYESLIDKGGKNAKGSGKVHQATGDEVKPSEEKIANQALDTPKKYAPKLDLSKHIQRLKNFSETVAKLTSLILEKLSFKGGSSGRYQPMNVPEEPTPKFSVQRHQPAKVAEQSIDSEITNGVAQLLERTNELDRSLPEQTGASDNPFASADDLNWGDPSGATVSLLKPASDQPTPKHERADSALKHKMFRDPFLATGPSVVQERQGSGNPFLESSPSSVKERQASGNPFLESPQNPQELGKAPALKIDTDQSREALARQKSNDVLEANIGKMLGDQFGSQRSTSVENTPTPPTTPLKPTLSQLKGLSKSTTQPPQTPKAHQPVREMIPEDFEKNLVQAQPLPPSKATVEKQKGNADLDAGLGKVLGDTFGSQKASSADKSLTPKEPTLSQLKDLQKDTTRAPQTPKEKLPVRDMLPEGFEQNLEQPKPLPPSKATVEKQKGNATLDAGLGKLLGDSFGSQKANSADKTLTPKEPTLSQLKDLSQQNKVANQITSGTQANIKSIQQAMSKMIPEDFAGELQQLQQVVDHADKVLNKQAAQNEQLGKTIEDFGTWQIKAQHTR